MAETPGGIVRVLTSGFDALSFQQRDPVAFLQAMHRYPGPVWWSAWGVRIGVLVTVVSILAVLAGVMGKDLKAIVGVALLFPLIMQMLCSLLISILGEAQFWFLYAYSPFILGIALCCGLGVHFPLWRFLGLQLAFPFCIGKLVSDAGTLWVHLEVERDKRERQHQRPGGVSAVLPHLSLWRRVRTLRWIAAGVLGAAIAYLYPALFPQSLWGFPLLGSQTRTFHMATSIIAGTAGCLGLDASLLAMLFRIPTLHSTSKTEWQVTYVGRVAMVLPPRFVQGILTSDCPFGQQSAMLLALLRRGCLGPTVKRACATLPPQHLVPLLLHLSLQEGGGEALRYLHVSLPVEVRPISTLYAALAFEAVKPLALQRWIYLLDIQLPDKISRNLDDHLAPLQTLTRIREALLALKHTPEIDGALKSLLGLIENLKDDRAVLHTSSPMESSVLAWPTALLLHLEQHRRRLQTV